MQGWDEAREAKERFSCGEDLIGRTICREQLVDLLAKGYAPEVLDMAPPIHISERFRREFCPDLFDLTVELLDENEQQLHTFATGQQMTEGSCVWEGARWEVAAQILTDYGPGVRFIRWKDGGKDREYWQGHYGVVIDGAYLAIQEQHEDALHLPRSRELWDLELAGGIPPCGRHRQRTCDDDRPVICDEHGHCIPGEPGPHCILGYAVGSSGECERQPVTCCNRATAPSNNGLYRIVDGSDVARITLWTAAVEVPWEGAGCGAHNTYARALLHNPVAPAGPAQHLAFVDTAAAADLDLMINASFFLGHPYRDECLEPEGVTVSNFVEVASEGPSHDVATETLVFYRRQFIESQGPIYSSGGNRYADILSAEEYEEDRDDVYSAVSGHQLIHHSEILPVPPHSHPDPPPPGSPGSTGIDPDNPRLRTVVGLNAAGDTAVVLVVNPGEDRDGMTIGEAAQFLLEYSGPKITDAIVLDGSGSSQLFYRPAGTKSPPSDLDRTGAVSERLYRPIPTYLGFKPGEPPY